MQKHHIHASKHTFREQEVKSNVAHLRPANNTVNRLNSLLSLIRVTAGVGVCPSPPSPTPPHPTHPLSSCLGNRFKTQGKKRKTWKLNLKTFGYEATPVTKDAKQIKLDKKKSTLSGTNIKTCRQYSALRANVDLRKRTTACASERRIQVNHLFILTCPDSERKNRTISAIKTNPLNIFLH